MLLTLINVFFSKFKNCTQKSTSSKGSKRDETNRKNYFFRWYKFVDGTNRKHLVTLDDRVKQVSGTLIIREAKVEDSGKYLCVVNNSVGGESVETVLTVTGEYPWPNRKLSAKQQPFICFEYFTWFTLVDCLLFTLNFYFPVLLLFYFH